MQEEKALTSRGRGRLRGFLELRRPWGFSPEARRGSQGASREAPVKSGLHARGEGERVLALESREGTRASFPFLHTLSSIYCLWSFLMMAIMTHVR